MTISRENMFAPMLAACPTFVPEWESFLDDWKEQDVDLQLYLALYELASHIIERIRLGDEKELKRIFDVIESWHLEGDEYVVRASEVGLLERVKHAKGPKDTGAFKKFRSRLKPASRKAWDAA